MSRRRGTQRAAVNPEKPEYRTVFAGFPLMRERLAQIVSGKPDPSPGLTNCRSLELTISALANGSKPPFAISELNITLERAMREAFILRELR